MSFAEYKIKEDKTEKWDKRCEELVDACNCREVVGYMHEQKSTYKLLF